MQATSTELARCRPQSRCFGTHRPTRDNVSQPRRPSSRCCALEGQAPEVPSTSRRELGIFGVATLGMLALPENSRAIGFKKELKKRKVPIEEYSTSEGVADGLKYYDVEEGSGKEIQLGDTVTVHFDCIFKGIDAVSSRSARTLGGNRTVAEPYEFVVGERVAAVAAKKADGPSAGGLYAGTSGPKPPPALSKAVVGMKPGGKRIVLVDNPELGYKKGILEIPAGATFELKVEVLRA